MIGIAVGVAIIVAFLILGGIVATIVDNNYARQKRIHRATTFDGYAMANRRN